MDREKLFFRMLDVIEGDIVPLTARGVSIGCKVFGAAANHATRSPNSPTNAPQVFNHGVRRTHSTLGFIHLRH